MANRPRLVNALTVCRLFQVLHVYIYICVYLSIYLSIYPSIHPSIYICTHTWYVCITFPHVPNTSSRACELVTWLICLISGIFVAALTQGRESAWFPVLSAGFPFSQLPKHLLLFRRRLSAPDTGHSNDAYVWRITMTCGSFPSVTMHTQKLCKLED